MYQCGCDDKSFPWLYDSKEGSLASSEHRKLHAPRLCGLIYLISVRCHIHSSIISYVLLRYCWIFFFIIVFGWCSGCIFAYMINLFSVLDLLCLIWFNLLIVCLNFRRFYALVFWNVLDSRKKSQKNKLSRILRQVVIVWVYCSVYMCIPFLRWLLNHWPLMLQEIDRRREELEQLLLEHRSRDDVWMWSQVQ